MQQLQEMLIFLWPPYELTLLVKHAGANNLTFADALLKCKIESPELEDADFLADAEKLASSLLEAETKRKEVLESKAATFVVAPTVATAITAAVVTVINGLGPFAAYAAVYYIAALIHFFVSSLYAIKVRQVGGFIVLSSTNARELLSKDRVKRVETRLAYALLNEPLLLMKSNQLSLSEEFFVRGVTCLGVGTLIALVAHMAR